jgi:ubiquinone/menaquinone biosynthesis C-methylase UbiE
VNTVEVFDRAAQTYDAIPFPFFTPFGGALVEYAGIRSGERVLDTGCGSGAVLVAAARAGAAVVGVELSPAMAERARAAVPAAEVHVGDAARLDFPDTSFDVVLSGFVIFFIDDPTAALRDWRRVLRPVGRLAISTWGGPDPRWSFEREIRKPYIELLDRSFREQLGPGIKLLERFDEPGKVEAELRASGFGAIEVVEHQIEFVFRSEQEWWDWNYSHAARMFFDALPPDALGRYKAEVEEGMQQVRDGRGFPRTYTALFARAHA